MRTDGHPRGTLSVSELRTAMQQHLRSSGALRQLKTQLRGMVLTELMQQPTTAHLLVRGAAQSVSPGFTKELPAPSGSPPPPPVPTSSSPVAANRTDPTLQSWSCGLADALVENHLRRTRRAMSLSLFATEAEVPPFSASGAPSEEEAYLRHLFLPQPDSTSDGGGSGTIAPEDDFLSVSPLQSMKSVLQQLVEGSLNQRGGFNSSLSARHLHHCSTQTEEEASTEGVNALNSLECRLAAVDAKYALTYAQLRRTCPADGEQRFFARSEVERRLQQYKSDMREQLRAEYETKYRTFERTKLQDAKDAAEERYRLLMRTKTEELSEAERMVLLKMDQERQRLKLSWEEVQQQRAEMERRQRDMAQQLADHEAEVQRYDADLHSVRETVRVLKLQCSKWEELCGTRLMEAENARSRESRRVEDLRRLQAEHVSELRIKDEEISRLRFRLRMLSKAEVAESPRQERSGAGDRESPGHPEAKQQSGVSPLAPVPVREKELYGLLLRTEEMQRNALVQQQQQQQWLDSAWVAATSAGPSYQGAPAMSFPVSGVTPTSAPYHSAPMLQQTPKQDAPPFSIPATASPPSPPSTSSGPKEEAVTEAPAAPLTAVKKSPKNSSPSSSASSHSVAPDKTPSRHSSEARSDTPKSSHHSARTPPVDTSSHSINSTASKESREEAVEAAASVTNTSGSLHSSTSRHSSQSSRVSVAPEAGKNEEQLPQEEAGARADIEAEESNARAGVVWSENNQRSFIPARRVSSSGSDRSSRRSSNSSDSRRGTGNAGRMLDQYAAAREQQRLEQDNIIYRDDSSDGEDSFIYAKSGSDSSF